jgi:hypothetical protein
MQVRRPSFVSASAPRPRGVQVQEDRIRHGLAEKAPQGGGGTVEDLVNWWVTKHLAKKASASRRPRAI